MAPGQFKDDDDIYPPDSIGQPESMRNQEQRLRDGEGGSELTDRPDDNPVGAPGETASAEAEGPPPVTRPDPSEQATRTGDTADIGAPVRSLGPPETTLPEQSPLDREFQPGGAAGERNTPPAEEDKEAPPSLEKLREARVERGQVVPPEERGE